ncbi:hypothetical protein [Streptomyces camelliae]|uniref:Uncharacterized protein n=1 Tax=Streptomyces camelliae TaxID=3004093 RepID=A0ABY7PIK2_9ACTN|nr:hypothetical protein [Streptomyces sp. HUAS 2-6]WBO68831.1 hypothetical protein O1G22_41565 [Streptomyces sp. HUAS 2-6]
MNKQENNSQGGAITTWRRQFHVMVRPSSGQGRQARTEYAAAMARQSEQWGSSTRCT